MMKRLPEESEDLVQCQMCGIYLKKAEGFVCSICRRGLLCKKHKIEGSKECASCVFERKRKTFSTLKEQETSLTGFLRFLQFVFIIFAVFLVAIKMGLDQTVDFLQYDFIKNSLPHIIIITVLGYIVFYGIRLGQRSRITKLESEMKQIEIRR
jgi:hypothetical protein